MKKLGYQKKNSQRARRSFLKKGKEKRITWQSLKLVKYFRKLIHSGIKKI